MPLLLVVFSASVLLKLSRPRISVTRSSAMVMSGLGTMVVVRSALYVSNRLMFLVVRYKEKRMSKQE